METTDTQSPAGCSGDCAGCSSGGHNHSLPTESAVGGLSGWKLATAAMVAFLLPLLCGIAGSAIIEPQSAGVAGGVALGLALAVVLSRWLTRSARNASTELDKQKESE